MTVIVVPLMDAVAVAAGGLLKNAFLMQLFADICRRPLSTATSSQAPALGAAIYAAVAAGLYPDVFAASAAMGGKVENQYVPNEERALEYDPIYAEYLKLHDYFGRGGNDVMYKLRQIQTVAEQAAAQVRAIAAAADQQAVSARSIMDSMDDVSEIARENADRADDASRHFDNLANQTGALTGLIKQLNTQQG